MHKWSFVFRFYKMIEANIKHVTKYIMNFPSLF
jgi:hypothetical protein